MIRQTIYYCITFQALPVYKSVISTQCSIPSYLMIHWVTIEERFINRGGFFCRLIHTRILRLHHNHRTAIRSLRHKAEQQGYAAE